MERRNEHRSLRWFSFMFQRDGLFWGVSFWGKMSDVFKEIALFLYVQRSWINNNWFSTKNMREILDCRDLKK